MLGRCPQKAQCTLYALHTGCWSQPLACQGVTLILLPALLPFWSPEPHRCRVAPRTGRSSSGLTPCCLLEETLRKESSDPPAQRGAVQPDLPCAQNVAFLVTTSHVSSRENTKKGS